MKDNRISDFIFEELSCNPSSNYFLFKITLEFFYRIKYIGRERKQKNQTYIVAPNHISYLDVFLVSICFRGPISYMAKKELFELALSLNGRLSGEHGIGCESVFIFSGIEQDGIRRLFEAEREAVRPLCGERRTGDGGNGCGRDRQGGVEIGGIGCRWRFACGENEFVFAVLPCIRGFAVIGGTPRERGVRGGHFVESDNFEVEQTGRREVDVADGFGEDVTGREIL